MNSRYKLKRNTNPIIDLLLSLLGLALLTLIAVVGLRSRTVTLPANMGNAPEKLEYISRRADPCDFTFICTGDVKQGTATFKKLLEIAAADRPAFFAVLGDFASDPEIVRHRHFIREVADAQPPFPLLLVPGNHDVHTEGPFTEADYEELYGAFQFHFTVGPYLFIAVQDAEPYDVSGAWLGYLENVFGALEFPPQATFVFMHVPIRELNPRIHCRPVTGADRFLDLARKHNITYVFSGDHHGYVKTPADGTTHIVCGGGGDKLRGEHGRFHHMMRISVQNGRITETVIAIPEQAEVFQRLERNIAIHLWPAITTNIFTIFLFVAAGAAVLYGLTRAVLRLKQP